MYSGISNRLGLTSDSKSPLQTEKELQNIPETLIPKAHHWLYYTGVMFVQHALRKCTTCGLSTYCKILLKPKN